MYGTVDGPSTNNGMNMCEHMLVHIFIAFFVLMGYVCGYPILTARAGIGGMELIVEKIQYKLEQNHPKVFSTRMF